MTNGKQPKGFTLVSALLARLRRAELPDIKVQPLRGFTLIELLLAGALVGLVGVLLAAIYFANFRLFSNQDVAIKISDQTRLALDEMTNQIRQSNQVFRGCEIDGSTTTLGLKLWRIDASQNPIEGMPEDEIVYAFDSTKKTITKTITPQTGSSRQSLTNKIIATDVKTVSFTCGSANPADIKQVSISLTTEAKTFNKTHTITQEAKGLLRNK